MFQKKGKLKKPVEGKQVGTQLVKTFKVGKIVKVDRARLDTGAFVLWFGDNYVTRIPAIELPDTVDFD